MSQLPSPPKWIDCLLTYICEPELLDSILGDLKELYEERLNTKSKTFANWTYCFDALGFLRPSMWRKITFTNPIDMIKSYFKLAFRNFWREKTVSSINILGFTIGISCCLLIALYIKNEASFDSFHDNKNQIYRLAMDLQQQNGEMAQTAFSPAPWAPAMKEEFPEIQSFTRFMRYRLPIAIEEKSTQKQFYERDFMWADSAVFNIFSFPLISGNPATALTRPHTVVISESAAGRYFGNADPIGKVISYEGREDLTITGVFEDFPSNSHLKADFLASFSSLNSFWDIIDNWRINYYYSYFLLEKDSDIVAVNAKMPDFINKHLGEEGLERFHPQWQALSDIHLNSKRENELEAGGDGRLLYLFAGIALLILFVAGANYINLATARAIERSKEIGIRKVLGSKRDQLIFQFLIESVLQVFIALLLAISLTLLVLPIFNEFTEKDIRLFSSNGLSFLLLVLGSAFLFSLVAGLYPAFHLAQMRPIQAFKPSNTSSNKLSFRQFLVVFQFATCGALIAGAIIVNAQFDFMLTKDLGFAKDQTLLFRTNGEYLNDPQNIATFKKQLLVESGVKTASIASHRIVGDQPYYASYRFEGIEGINEAMGMGRLHIDEDFVQTYDIPLLAGRAFDKNRIADTSAFLINKMALQRLGITSPENALGKLIAYETRGENGTYLRRGPIIGVTDDFHFRSLHFQIEPMVMDIQPARYHFVAVKMDGRNLQSNIKNLEQKWQRIYPDSPFEYNFLDNLLARQYETEQKTKTLFGIFSLVGILIACLGLFGLATFITNQRTKEIGVRKILGATALQIMTLLSKDLLILILVALLFGMPLAYYVAHTWLEGFSYHITLGAKFFIITVLVTTSIALLTINLQALKAIFSNPIHAIREK